MRAAGMTAMAMLVGTGLCAPAAVADKGGEPHDGSNGQGRPEQRVAGAPPAAAAPATPVAAKPGHKAAKRHGHAKKHPRPAASTERPKAAPAPKSSAPSQAPRKTTICHHTGSKSHPWVTITIANPALAAHRRHGDLIPAPAGGCPKAAAAPAPVSEPPSSPASPSAVEEPDAGGPPPVIVTLPAAKRARSESSSPPGAVLAAHAQSATPVAARTTTASSRGRVRVLTASAPATPAAGHSGGRMPYTGLMAWLVAIAGAGALLAGVTLRRVQLTRHR